MAILKSASRQISSPIASPACGDDGLGSTWLFWRRKRYIIAVLAFAGYIVLVPNRGNLSITIVAMTENKSVELDNDTVICTRDFDWDSRLQGHMLGAFFYGYDVSQILGGWLAVRVGGNVVFGLGATFSSLFTVITPPLTYANGYILIAIRVLVGFFQGIAFPSMHAIWSRWAPPHEKNTLATMGIFGMFVGYAISFFASGVLAQTVGWPSVFYVFGTLGLIWSVIWWLVAKADPADDPYIAPEELKYIKESLGTKPEEILVHPWRKFFTSLPWWAIVVAHTCDNWGFYTLMTQLPTFMKETLHYQMEETGFITGFPYLLLGITGPIAGRVADWLCNDTRLSVTQVRKLYCCGSFLLQMSCFLVASQCTHAQVVLAAFSISIVACCFSWSSFCVNLLDIAPQHASVLLGLSNTIASLPGILSPMVAGMIVQNHKLSEWRIVFYIASGFYLFGAIFYGIFATGERQTWAAQEKQAPTQNGAEHGHTNEAMEQEGA